MYILKILVIRDCFMYTFWFISILTWSRQGKTSNRASIHQKFFGSLVESLRCKLVVSIVFLSVKQQNNFQVMKLQNAYHFTVSLYFSVSCFFDEIRFVKTEPQPMRTSVAECR